MEWETVTSDGRWDYQVRRPTPNGKWYGRKKSTVKNTVVSLGSHVDRGALVRELERKAGKR